MADVGERAQVLLMAALGMAILFVALALILNTAIYTENLATRGSEIAGGGEAVRYLETAHVGVGDSIVYVNRHNDSSHDALQQNLTEAVDEWSNTSRRHFAHRGRTVDVSLDETKTVTWIKQENAGRNFTDKEHNANWTVAEDVNETRNFRIYIPDADDLESYPTGNEFRIDVDDGDDSWELYVSDESNQVEVVVKTDTTEEYCDPAPASAWINVTDGTVGGDDCEALSFAEGVDGPYDITFHNANNVTGTFSMAVDNKSLATSPEPHLHDEAASGYPYATPAIYSANLSVTYQTPRIYYDATIRVAPGETDD